MQIKKLSETATLPSFAHDSDAGMDLYANQAVTIEPGERALIDTGIALAIPAGHVGLIWDKSGVATKRGLKTLAGVIDAGYRGEVKIALVNTGTETQAFAVGEKVAQMLIQKVTQPELELVTELPDTQRGEGGFGSTGT